MSGKIEISREQAEVLISIIDPRITDRATIWTLQSRLARVINEVKDILAAPVVERQEPAQWQRKSQMHEETWYPLPADEVSEAKRQGWEIRALYTSPPAPVAVMLPERKQPRPEGDNTLPSTYNANLGWNACLDKVKELNQ